MMFSGSPPSSNDVGTAFALLQLLADPQKAKQNLEDMVKQSAELEQKRQEVARAQSELDATKTGIDADRQAAYTAHNRLVDATQDLDRRRVEVEGLALRHKKGLDELDKAKADLDRQVVEAAKELANREGKVTAAERAVDQRKLDVETDLKRQLEKANTDIASREGAIAERLRQAQQTEAQALALKAKWDAKMKQMAELAAS